jgi:hypothetical protein
MRQKGANEYEALFASLHHVLGISGNAYVQLLTGTMP